MNVFGKIISKNRLNILISILSNCRGCRSYKKDAADAATSTIPTGRRSVDKGYVEDICIGHKFEYKLLFHCITNAEYNDMTNSDYQMKSL